MLSKKIGLIGVRPKELGLLLNYLFLMFGLWPLFVHCFEAVGFADFMIRGATTIPFLEIITRKVVVGVIMMRNWFRLGLIEYGSSHTFNIGLCNIHNNKGLFFCNTYLFIGQLPLILNEFELE